MSVPVAGLVWGWIWGFPEFMLSGGAGPRWARSRLESSHCHLRTLKAGASSWVPGGERTKSPWHKQAGDPLWIRPRAGAAVIPRGVLGWRGARGPAWWWEGSSWLRNALPSSGAELGGAQLPRIASLVAESLLSVRNEIRGVIPVGRSLRSALPQIGSLENYYHFHHSKTFKRSTLSSRGPHTFLRMDPKGRRGLGSIFVWASGNGGREGDYCSCDGYTNSIYTISISSTTENGYKPWYLEECASTLATTYSSGAFYERKIVTTDLRHRCTDGHTGTSVSAPMVAGIIALALEANPLLTWRDVQHLLVRTSRPVHLRAADWKTNGAGHKVSHLYGFGLVDAEAIVVEAKKWKTVPPQHVCVGSLDRVPKYIRPDHVLRASTLSSACSEQREQHVQYLEHVVVRLSIAHPRRGDLQISLISPAGTRSQLLARRVFDHSNEGFKGWEFMTVHCWGERAAGEWTLEIQDTPSQVRSPAAQGKLKEWSLLFYGTAEHPYNTLGAPQPRARPPEASEMEPSRAAFLQSQVEVAEEEEEYAGPCHPECGDQGCDGPSADQCLNCIHYSLGSVKSGRMCVSSCPTGFFGDKAARRCRRCYKGCESCVGRGPGQCTACKRSLYHHPEMGACLPLCPPGFYAEERQKRCLKCHQNCKKCLGEPDKCTACKDGFSLAGESCVPECQPTMYLSREPRRCESCPAGAGPGEEECTPCSPETPTPHWRCVPACREGFYPADSHGLPSKVCKRCEDHCSACEGSSGNCIKCKEGFSLLGGSCVTNETCTNADKTFCEMVKSNKLCEKKLFVQFCCQTCLMAG
nr:proprotein convertase subtilisin/kexin type 6 isoform X2 [Anser cygnoides]